MEKIFKIATSISTPLGATGLILAILCYVFLQIIKSKNVSPIFYVIVKYLFILSLCGLFLGFLGFMFTKYYEVSKNIILKGIVFVGGQELADVGVEILEARVTTQTDPYGNFTLSFDKSLRQDSYTIKFTNKYILDNHAILTIKIDSTLKHFYLKEKKDNVQIAVPNPTSVQRSNDSKEQNKTNNNPTIIVSNPKPPDQRPHFMIEINFDSLYNANSGNELKLSDYGKLAYESEKFNSVIKFYERAHAIQSSKVWESNIPYLIAAYWKQNQNQNAEEAINYMYQEASVGPGYLNHNTTIGFLIQNFGYIRNTLSPTYQSKVDQIVDKLVEIKKQVP